MFTGLVEKIGSEFSLASLLLLERSKLIGSLQR